MEFICISQINNQYRNIKSRFESGVFWSYPVSFFCIWKWEGGVGFFSIFIMSKIVAPARAGTFWGVGGLLMMMKCLSAGSVYL